MTRCSICVGDHPKCPLCKGLSIKYGKTSSGKQRYLCNLCGKTFLVAYSNQTYVIDDSSITALVKEGCGIRSISRLLRICCSTVLRRIKRISKNIVKPVMVMNKEYEVDEMRTYYRNKGRKLWIAYALQRDTKTVVDFIVGTRTKITLGKIINTLLLSRAEKIYTDRLNLYSFLVPKYLHCTRKNMTNNIERKNLSVRTHLKRLNRRTICYTKSIAMLCECLKIYFWS